MQHVLERMLVPLALVCGLVATPIRAGELESRNPAWEPFRKPGNEVFDDSETSLLTWPKSLADNPWPSVTAKTGAVELAAWTTPTVSECPVPVVAPPQPASAYPADPIVYYAASSWRWQVLPSGLIWQSYWAGVHEPRISGVTFAEKDGPWLLDVTLGGRAALLRYGGQGPNRPEGWELQIEGAGIPRLNLDANWDVDATDFRFGLPLIYGRENLQWKLSYYHLSSHLGDELAIREDRLDERINFSRDVLVLGVSYFPLPAWRWYAETGWAFHFDDGSEPWEFQFGVDVAEPGPTGVTGTPFLAVNGHLREEHNYGGNLVVQAGWLWRGRDNQTMRLGFHYYNGKSSQFEFFDVFEEQIGAGVWYDF